MAGHHDIPVGGEPEGVDLRPDVKVVYVTSRRQRVFVIDAVDRTDHEFAVGPRPRSTGFLPAARGVCGIGKWVIDCCRGRGEHRVISTITLTGELVRPMGVVHLPMPADICVHGPREIRPDHRPATPCPKDRSKSANDRGASRFAGRRDGLHRERSVSRCIVRRRGDANCGGESESGRSAWGSRMSRTGADSARTSSIFAATAVTVSPTGRRPKRRPTLTLKGIAPGDCQRKQRRKHRRPRPVLRNSVDEYELVAT